MNTSDQIENAPIRILLIDDYPQMRTLVARMLGNEFRELQTIEISSREDFELTLEKGDFDLAITDYNLEWSTGIEMLQAIKARYPDLPVIMFTGTGTEEIAVAAMKSGLDDYVLKSPKHFSKLAAAVRSVLDTARQRRARQEAENRYHSLFNGIPIGLFRITPDFAFLDVNAALVELLGYPDRKSLINTDVRRLYVDAADHRRWLDLMNRDGRVINFESQRRRRDGSLAWYRENTRANRDGREAVRYYEGSLEDITKHRETAELIRKNRDDLNILVRERTADLLRANKRLRQEIDNRRQVFQSLASAQTNLRNIITMMADAIIIVDKNGIVRFVNPAGEALFERKAEEFVGKSFGLTLVEGATTEIAIAREAGEKITAEMMVSPITWEDDIAHIASLRNMTERKKLEQLKDEFIATVSHELRTPLSSMKIGVGQIVDGIQGALNPNQKEILSLTLGEIDRMTRIVNNLLDVSKIETGNVQLQKSFVDIVTVIEKTAGHFEGAVREQGLEIKITATENNPRVLADPDRIGQVISNLIGNALQHTLPGGTIGVEVHPEQGYVRCTVSDTGVGIPRQDLSRIFNKFTRLGNNPKGGTEGSGLGLAISRILVEMHGGKIWAESEPGRGTRVSFQLPDYKNEKLFRERLRDEIEEARKAKEEISLLGIRLEQTETLKEQAGEKLNPFLEQLSVIIGEIPTPPVHFWDLENTGEFVGILRGKPGEQIPEHLLSRLRKIQFLLNGKPVDLELSVAGVEAPAADITEASLMRMLRERLREVRPLSISSRRERSVLVTDDNEDVVGVISRLLTLEKVKPLKAYDGTEAMEILGRETPDMIILDMIMPEMSGYEVIERLKRDPRTANIPLLLISAHDIDEMRLTKGAAGAIPTLAKPFNVNELLKIIQSTLKTETINISC